MCICSSLSKHIVLQLIVILISIFMTECEDNNHFLSTNNKNYCPFIETVSFGSDINITCNNSYFIFNEINSEQLNWKFADQTPICRQNGTQKAYSKQCGVTRIGPNYLKVPLISLNHNEKACAYCRINYKPIAPKITATQSDDGLHTSYTFNLTATGLAHDESFEILWAKRVSDSIHYSYNFWFLHKCIDSIVKILDHTNHTITFAVDDAPINRAEFIIRRCNGTCRTYDICSEEKFSQETSSDYFRTPDSIEKISCDYDCLRGITTTIISTTTHLPPSTLFSSSSSSSSSPSTQSSNALPPTTTVDKMTFIIISITIGVLLIILMIIIILCVTCRVKGKKHVYAKTNNIDPDEHK